MDIARYTEIERVFAEVIDLPPEVRSDAIHRLAADEPLAQAVAELVAEHERLASSPFLADDLLTDRLDWSIAHEPSPPLPTDINGYKIIRILGKGASGTVYLAQSPPPLSRLVALKLIHADASKATVARFREEQRVLASLEHRGIARVFLEGVTADNRAFTVLEYIEGSIITDYCAQRSLDWRAVTGLLVQACDAVAHAHQRNIIHRDLKPSNLLVTQVDGLPLVKVIDFGIAKLVDPLRKITALTLDAQFVGTLPYASPEQLDGSDTSDTRSDVHALGVVLYESITHRHPFCADTDSLKATINAITSMPAPALEPMTGVPTRELDAILARACAKDPEERYPSPGHLGEELRRLLAGHPLVAMKPRPGYVMRKFIGRHQASLALAGIVLAALVFMGGVAIDKGFDAARNRDAMRETAIKIVDDVLPMLADLSGSTTVRKELAASLHDRIDELLAADPSDRELLVRKARILEYKSDILLADSRTDESEALRLEAASIISLLRSENARSANELFVDERRLIIKLGDIAKDRKDYDTARTYYERAHDLLLAQPGDNRESLCWSLERLAFLAMRQDRRQDAMDLNSERLEIALELNTERPGTPSLVRNCGVAHHRMSDLLDSQGRYDESYLHAIEAARFADELTKLDPDKFTTDHLEFSASIALMSTSYLTGRTAEGDALAERVRRLGCELMERNPNRLEASKIAWVGLKSLRRRLTELGRLEAADEIAAEMQTLRPDAPLKDLTRFIPDTDSKP